MPSCCQLARHPANTFCNHCGADVEATSHPNQLTLRRCTSKRMRSYVRCGGCGTAAEKSCHRFCGLCGAAHVIEDGDGVTHPMPKRTPSPQPPLKKAKKEAKKTSPVTLAKKFDSEKHDVKNGGWLISEKLDGVRFHVCLDTNRILSRTGKVI